tara:strand:+ start:1160 stop:1369 length:210 start_codon:yes stop_codon:yes gene_type:complete
MHSEQTLINTEHPVFRMLDLLDKPQFMPALLNWLEAEGYKVSKKIPDSSLKGQQQFDWVWDCTLFSERK